MMAMPQLLQTEIDSGIRAAVNVFPGARYPRVILLCEHGGNLVPPAWANLGIARDFFDTHFGSDIGAADITIDVASRLGATAIVSNYSRLFLDYNRHSNDPDCFKLDMGGIPIPGNWELSPEEKELRQTLARAPLEQAVEEWTAGDGDGPLLLISIHSFSPVWSNQPRDCEIGVMWREDERLAPKLIEALRLSGDIKIDDNQPYDFRTSDWFTLKRHGLDANVPCAYVEIRNSFLTEEDSRAKVADILTAAIDRCIRDI